MAAGISGLDIFRDRRISYWAHDIASIAHYDDYRVDDDFM